MSIENTLSEQTAVDAEKYVAERKKLEHLKAVEFGHGVLPIAFKNPTYTGDRFYTGVETWFRGCHPSFPVSSKDKTIAKLNEDPILREQNIALIHHETGGEIMIDPDTLHRPSFDSWHTGPYDATTNLESGTANEVFAGNVFNDPHTAYNNRNAQLLLTELARVVSDDGFVILRETLTPIRFNLTDEMIEKAGLSVAAKITPDMVYAWQALEAEFAGDSYFDTDRSFYLFLQKITQ